MKSHYITSQTMITNDDLPDDPIDALEFIRAEKALMSRRIGDIEMKLSQACRHNEVVELCNDLVLFARRYESLDAKQRRIENRVEEMERQKLKVGGE